MVNIAIFASGKGSNAANICNYFKDHPVIKVECILSDRRAAGVFDVAKEYGVKAVYLSKESPHPRPLSKGRGEADAREISATPENSPHLRPLSKGSGVAAALQILDTPVNILTILSSFNIKFIVLAGYLKLMAVEIINAYRNRVINIHPALLPKYGGKGMYGMKVHEAVCKAGEAETGITIHHVDEHYDEGDIIFQSKVKVDKTDTPEQVAEKIHTLEMEYFPKVIEEWIINNEDLLIKLDDHQSW